VTEADVMNIATQTIVVALKLAGPILVVSLGIGLLISLFQSATQVQEVTLTFVPKLAGVALVLVFGGNWMLAEILGFTRGLFNMLPGLLG